MSKRRSGVDTTKRADTEQAQRRRDELFRSREITERKRAEEALRESEERFRLMAEMMPDAVLVGQDGRNVYANTAAAGLLHAAGPEELVGLDVFALIAPTHREWAQQQMQRALAGEKQPPFEDRFVRLDGSSVPVEIAVSLLTWQGRPALQVVARDITERKRAEEALRESEAKYHALFQAGPDGVLVADLETRMFRYANPAACRLLGYSEAELTTMGVADIHPKDALPWVVAEFEAQTRGDKTLSAGVPFLRKDGAIVHADVNAVRVSVDGRACNVGFLRDVTARKRMEEALRASEELYRVLFERNLAGIMQTSLDGRILNCNEAFARIFGYASRDELMSRRASDLWFDPAGREAFVARIQGEATLSNVELRLRRKDGQPVWVLENLSVVKRGEGQDPILEATMLGITERKQAEEALRQSEENFEALAESASEGILIGTGEEGRHVYANRRAVEITGYPIEELLKTCMRDLAHPDELPKLAERYKERLERLEVPKPYETAFLNKDGIKVPIEISPSRTIWQNQLADMVMFRDITERKRAEDALRESEERFRSLVENATVGIYRTTPDGHILMTNPALARMLGFDSFEELATRNLECEGFEPSYPRSVFRERIEREGQVVGLEAAWIRRDGSVIFVRESARAVRAEDGRVLHYDGIVEDVTTRRHAEEGMRQLSGRLLRLQDEERRRIARQLHETAAQSLAALAINLTMVKDSAADLSPRASACLAESLELAEQCSREIRTLSYLLHPPLVDEAGLAPALRWYTAGFAQRSGIAVHVDVSPELGRLPSEVELTLYRIVQEALTNIHLHSGSKTARICLERQPEEIVLRVADEGHGFPSAALGMAGPESTDIGVGIPGMRERLRQLGGRLHIQTGSRGTTLTAYLPLSEVARGETTHPTGG